MTNNDKGPRTSKSFSSSEEPNSRILRGYYGVKKFGHPAHFILSLRPTPRKKKCPMMNKESPKLPSSIVEDNPVLGQPRLWRGRAACHRRHARRASQEKGQVLWVSHGSLVEEQFREKLSPPH